VHAEIANTRDALIALCERYDVARLEVFGSAPRNTDFDAPWAIPISWLSSRQGAQIKSSQ
jgi:hypothetical protein